LINALLHKSLHTSTVLCTHLTYNPVEIDEHNQTLKVHNYLVESTTIAIRSGTKDCCATEINVRFQRNVELYKIIAGKYDRKRIF